MIEEIKVSVEEMNCCIIGVEFHKLQNSEIFATGKACLRTFGILRAFRVRG
jgi:hypothetical protein